MVGRCKQGRVSAGVKPHISCLMYVKRQTHNKTDRAAVAKIGEDTE